MTSLSCPPLVPSPRTRSSSEILDILCRGLEAVLAEQCAHRYDIPVSIRRLEESGAEPSRVHLRLERRGLMHLAAQIRVSYVGGNIYDVRCGVEDGPSCQHSYSLPGNVTPHSTRAPHLATTLVDFLLDELERRVGRQQLRQSAILLPAQLPAPVREDASASSSQDSS